jgi:hypothetical protein
MTELNFHKINETQEKPVVLIIGGDNLINNFLNKSLLLSNCQVFFFSKSLDKEILKKANYVFCFDQDFSLIKEILNLAPSTTKFLFALESSSGKDNLENKILQLSLMQKVNFRIIRYPFVYGPGMEKSALQYLKKLDNLSKDQALFISDFIYGLLKAMFGGRTNGGSFVLIGENKDLGWRAKVNFQEGFSEIEGTIKKERKIFPPIKIKKPVFFLLILLLFLAVTFPVTSLALWGWLGKQSLSQTESLILQGDILKAQQKSLLARNFFQKGKNQAEQIDPFLNLLSQEKTEWLNQLFDLGETTAEGFYYFLQAGVKTQSLLKAVSQKQVIDFNSLIEEIKSDLDWSFSQLSLAESQFNQSPEAEQIAKARNLILQARQGIFLLPELIGLKGKQTYLVLLQNNSELRPTGGFIGSYGLLTFDEGKLIDFEVNDVYSADGQLKGHVEPPSDLKKYLGEAGWYLRDSNWDPDFPTSAARAAWFLEKETGRRVDGVIGVNLTLAQQILKAIGEIQLPDYQEKINEANFFERAEYYSEINFFPGSTQKQDFLASVTRVLFEEIKTSEEKTWFALAKNIWPSFKTKDLLFWLADPQATTILADLGWDGAVKGVECHSLTGECLADYLMVVEANVGINKTNYFLKRSFSHHLQIKEDQTIQETLRLNYQNNSSSNSFPGGRYKSYVRIYTPVGATLKGMKIINPLSGEVSEVLEREVKEEHGKQVFGFLLEVPIQESRSIEVAWKLPQKLSEETDKYLLLLQKQPGIKDEAFSFCFITPDELRISAAKPLGSRTSEGFIFNPSFDQDLVFEIDLVK